MSSTLLLKLAGRSSSDAVLELERAEEEEDTRMYMDLGIPDEMLRCLDERHPLHTFIAEPLPGSMKLLYPRRGQTWRATLYDYYHSRTERQLTVKLSHDGFHYHKRRYKQAGISTHRRKDYFALGEDVLSDMPFLEQLKRRLEAKIVFLYNIKHKRIDIKFFKQEADLPFLLITFEPGHPETDLAKELRF
jgi:hypothetical protein